MTTRITVLQDTFSFSREKYLWPVWPDTMERMREKEGQKDKPEEDSLLCHSGFEPAR